MADEDGASKERSRRPDLITTLRDQIAVRRAIAGEVISLANLLGRPVVDVDDSRIGRVNDVAVHWEVGTAYPRVSGVLVSLSEGLALVSASEVTLEQAKVRVRSSQISVAKPVRNEGDIALARDVLDSQLVDVEGVQVVRAADVYLFRLSDGWELAGVDVGSWAYARRLLRKRRRCPPPRRAIDWADLQTFVPRTGTRGRRVSRVPRQRRAPSEVPSSWDHRPRSCTSFTQRRSPPSFRTLARTSGRRLHRWPPRLPRPRRCESWARNNAMRSSRS